MQWADELIGAPPSEQVFGGQLPDTYGSATPRYFRIWELRPDGSKVRHLELWIEAMSLGESPGTYVGIGNQLYGWLFNNDGGFVDP